MTALAFSRLVIHCFCARLQIWHAIARQLLRDQITVAKNWVTRLLLDYKMAQELNWKQKPKLAEAFLQEPKGEPARSEPASGSEARS